MEHKGAIDDTRNRMQGAKIMAISLKSAFEAIAFSALMMLILALPSLA
jgi:hypothetical protein